MSYEVNTLYRLIKKYRLDCRHPRELDRVVKRIEDGRMRPQQAKRWLKKIRPWIRQQEMCFNPFGPAPDQETLGTFDIELGELVENPGVRVGLRLDRPRHLMVAGATGAGKSNVLRKLIDGIDAINRDSGRIHRDS